MSGTTESRALISFGPFEVDLASQELRKHGVRLRLPRQSFQILKMLLERPGQLVSREDMRAALWPSDTFVDFEHSLNAAINKLREALGDDAENPSYIETLPKRGYRLIAEKAPQTDSPDSVHPPEPSPPAPAPSEFSPPRRSAVKVAAALLVALTLVIITLAATGLGRKLWSRFNPPPQIHSIAVLPLANLSGDPQQEYFADGMTDELITELSRLGGLRVISRTSVMQYKGEKKKSLSQIGRELNVDAVMEGSVLPSGNRVRISPKMIYAPTDQTLMAETYEGDLSDVLKLQREVARAVAQKVRLELSPEEQARLHDAPGVNPEAYKAYLLAASINEVTPFGIDRARNLFEKAIQLDPTFAPAYSGLAMNHVYSGTFRWETPKATYSSAKQAVDEALKLDRNDCYAYKALYYLSWRYDWNWQTAERQLRQCLDVCPNPGWIHFELAYFLGWGGRKDEALAELSKFRELEPLMGEPLQGESLLYYHLRSYKELTDVGPRYVASDPNNWGAHYLLGVGYQGKGQVSDAILEYQKAVELSHGDQDTIAALAYAYARTGNTAEAQKILNTFLEQSKTNYVSPYMIAAVYAGLANKDKAFEYLEKAYQERSPDLPYFLRADLRMDTLRSDPRFEDLLRRMNFPK